MDHINAEISKKNLEARYATSHRDRRRAYKEKTALIADAILRLAPEFLHLGYQVSPTGTLHVLTTIRGVQSIRAYHVPFDQLPGLVQLLTVERLGNPHSFIANWRAQGNCLDARTAPLPRLNPTTLPGRAKSRDT